MARGYKNWERGKKPQEDRDRHFVREFFTNGYNASAAAESAGFASARNYAYKLMREPRIIKLMDEYRERLDRKWEVNATKIRNELAKIAFGGGLGNILVVNEDDGSAMLDFRLMDQAVRDCIQEFTTKSVTRVTGSRVKGENEVETDRETTTENKVKFPSKQAALDALARIEGLFKQEKENKSDDVADRIAAGRNRVAEKKANGTQGA